ncbi:MAG: flagellar basal body rod protein FlgF [Cellvibrionaceae bacterium]|nr:flagellar basal body rod protein FlgF [Cellvibrionaceae bacterium]
MDKALYIAMSGAKQNMLSQTAHANNLANASTHGFKADFAQARSMPVFYGPGHPSRAFALSERPATNFNPGPMMETGRALDIAIEGDGFIAVQAPNGEEAYTRVGSLFVDSLGMVKTGNNLPVLGNGGPIALPPAATIEIAIDGSITVVPLEQGVEAVVLADRIKLVNPPLETLHKAEDGLFHRMEAEEDVVADARIRVTSGFLEGSNVNAVHELTSVMQLSRQYEMQVKIMQAAKEESESSARLLQNS